MIEWLLIAAARLLVNGPAVHASGQCIYVANHSSHLDALVLLSKLPQPLRRRTRPVVAADYWTRGPLRRYIVRLFRGVPIDRRRQTINPLEHVSHALRNGDSLILFPEGTRGAGKSLQPLKPGIFHMARAFPDVEIVPAWINLPKGLTFGAPFRWKAGQRQEEFLSEVREALEALQP